MPTLYVVATPIGNLGDLSPRALSTFSSVGFIIAEDTRVTAGMLNHFDIHKPLLASHRHNEMFRAEPLIERMLTEQVDAALVTDAGTPCLCDPGFALVKAARVAGITVETIAGPSALAAAISISGMDCGQFLFCGFPPREKVPLSRLLVSLPKISPVAAFYESPRRVIAFLKAAMTCLPEANAFVAAELTKLHERVFSGTIAEVYQAVAAHPYAEKGEYVVLLNLAQCPPTKETPEHAEPILLDALLTGATAADAIALAIEQGIKPNDAKRAMLRLKRFQTL